MRSEEIGLYDNFFEIGGDSIKIVQLQHEINDQFEINTTVLTLFEHPTISAFSKHMEESGDEGSTDSMEKEKQKKSSTRSADMKKKLLARQKALSKN